MIDDKKDDKKFDDKKDDDKRCCCCCPDLGDVSGEYSHDAGALPGQFKKTLTLAPDGTFEYFASFDLGMVTSNGTWKSIPQGAKCFVELSSDPTPVNPLINVQFNRTLLHLDGTWLRTETGGPALAFRRMASVFPTKA
jgi:hypothetical protein